MTFRAVWALCATCVVAWSPAVVAQGQKAGPLTLPQALQRAANANPRIAAADRTIGMAEGRREQANALPNPTLGFEVDNFASGQSGVVQGAETTLQLSQLIELGGKRDARVAAALGDYDAARWQREAARLEMLSETTIAFVAALSAQRRIQILDAPGRRARAAGAADAAPRRGRRLLAGRGRRARRRPSASARLERERARTALAERAARARGADGRRPRRNSPRSPATSAASAAAAIRQPSVKAIEANPQLMRWTAVRAQRDAELLSARLKAVPDVTASVGWRHYSRDRRQRACGSASRCRSPCSTATAAASARRRRRRRRPRPSAPSTGSR